MFLHHMRQLECQLGILECWKRKKSPNIPHLLRSLRQTEYPKSIKVHNHSKLWAVFGVFAVKYTYFKPQNILIDMRAQLPEFRQTN